jgi:hypothetical protein
MAYFSFTCAKVLFSSTDCFTFRAAKAIFKGTLFDGRPRFVASEIKQIFLAHITRNVCQIFR